jgi:2-C-methyl-D-erythritol 2,4-cyclodiphosphate synthase
MTEDRAGTGYIYCSALGQDSHRFANDAEVAADPARLLVLGGVILPDYDPLAGNSDADVILHALTNAVSGLSGVNILGKIADQLCLEQGITDSTVYLAEALKFLPPWQLLHVSLSIECRRPRLADWIEPIKCQIAGLLHLRPDQVGLTATSGEGLTSFGCGEGIQVFCIISARRPVS